MAEKMRSPKYPIMGLGIAIERLQSLWEREKTASVNTDVAVKAWGYSGLSGPALQTIATLTQYGLVERAGTQKIKISELGLDILLPKTSDDKLRAIHIAASQPTIFRELTNEYPTDLPSDETLKATLVRRSVPYTEDAAVKIIKTFKETQDLLKLPEMTTFKEKEQEIKEKEKKATGGFWDLMTDRKPSPQVSAPPSLTPKPKEGDYHLSIPLKGRVATLIIPNGEPTKKDLEAIKNFMDFIKEVNAEDEPKKDNANG